MIKINRKRIEAYLQQKLHQLERNPDFWTTLEEVGRCLASLHDPRAPEYFRRAAHHYPLCSASAGSQLQQANLQRLAGDTDDARQHYQQAHDLLMPLDFTDKENDVKLDQLALCAYMVGDDALTLKAVDHLRPLCRKGEWLNTFALVDLAAARQQQAQTTVATIEADIRKSRYHPTDTGSFTPWNIY